MMREDNSIALKVVGFIVVALPLDTAMTMRIELEHRRRRESVIRDSIFSRLHAQVEEIRSISSIPVRTVRVEVVAGRTD